VKHQSLGDQPACEAAPQIRRATHHLNENTHNHDALPIRTDAIRQALKTFQ
jgi:hypothetical protein